MLKLIERKMFDHTFFFFFFNVTVMQNTNPSSLSLLMMNLVSE